MNGKQFLQKQMCSNIYYFCSYKFYHWILYILWDGPVKNRKDVYGSTEKNLSIYKMIFGFWKEESKKLNNE